MPKIKHILSLILLQVGILSTCAQTNSTISILNSESIFTEEHKWSVLSVELRDDCTIVEKYVCPIDEDITWISSDKSEFIEDADTGERYYIVDSEIGFEDNKIILHNEQRYFKEKYPPLPKGVTNLNISTGLIYYVERVDLTGNRSPLNPPVSNITFLGIPLGIETRKAVNALKKMGFEQFYREKDSFIGIEYLDTYLYGNINDYPVTIKLESSLRHGVVESVEIMYQNHVDDYEVEEHINEIIYDVRSTYPIVTWQYTTPQYRHATSMLNQRSGKGIFKNVTIIELEEYYSIFTAPGLNKYQYEGTIHIAVHNDNLHQDKVVVIRYHDRMLSDYIRRDYGELRW